MYGSVVVCFCLDDCYFNVYLRSGTYGEVLKCC